MYMPKNLVIVESPAKAKTIAQYLGKDYDVKSSFGHIRDLPKKELGVDTDKSFVPTYVISPDKKKIVADLKKAAKGKVVWLASDEDREGEAIAWHICHALGLDPAKTKRIVFHEITKPAILDAIKSPRTIDIKLVDAQQARRILDRLVGYELSPVLWKKVKTGLSAGRVQSVAVRLIVERERELSDFKPKSNFRVTAVFDSKGHELPAELENKLPQVEEAKDFLDSVKDSVFKVADVRQKPGKRSPNAPFTTSTLQQEAARRLGFSVRQTMSVAQKLYESGHITYMRTDSTILSGFALSAIQEYIVNKFGTRYYHSRQFQTKSQLAQEAHEAIRPTVVSRLKAGNDSSQEKLYELIWRRTLASQMAPAEVEKTEVKISIRGRSEHFVATGEVLKFDGFFKAMRGAKDDRILPDVKVGDELLDKSISALQTFGRSPARYSEASLVKKLEELGIGRPSTYAPTISTIQDRGYIEKKDITGEIKTIQELVLSDGEITQTTQELTVGSDRDKLLPTPLADVVTDFLVKHFTDVFNYDFTAKAEEELDNIADGKTRWQDMLKQFYDSLHPLIIKSEKVSREDASQARKLGKDPKTKKVVIARFGRYGPMLQLGETIKENGEPEEKPRFAPLPAGTSLNNVTLEQALPMFELPRVVGKTEDGQEITADIGRFGPYVKVGKMFVSIKKLDPMKISEGEAREAIINKNETEAKRVIADFGKIKILRGPYGPYITDGKKNARIAKDQDPEKFNEKESLELLKNAPDKKSRYKSRHKKK
jgi:DNA topoisomerase-1